MAILVTGAFGSIGSWIVKRLLAGGERPVIYEAGRLGARELGPVEP